MLDNQNLSSDVTPNGANNNISSNSNTSLINTQPNAMSTNNTNNVSVSNGNLQNSNVNPGNALNSNVSNDVADTTSSSVHVEQRSSSLNPDSDLPGNVSLQNNNANTMLGTKPDLNNPFPEQNRPNNISTDANINNQQSSLNSPLPEPTTNNTSNNVNVSLDSTQGNQSENNFVTSAPSPNANVPQQPVNEGNITSSNLPQQENVNSQGPQNQQLNVGIPSNPVPEPNQAPLGSTPVAPVSQETANTNSTMVEPVQNIDNATTANNVQDQNVVMQQPLNPPQPVLENSQAYVTATPDNFSQNPTAETSSQNVYAQPDNVSSQMISNNPVQSQAMSQPNPTMGQPLQPQYDSPQNQVNQTAQMYNQPMPQEANNGQGYSQVAQQQQNVYPNGTYNYNNPQQPVNGNNMTPPNLQQPGQVQNMPQGAVPPKAKMSSFGHLLKQSFIRVKRRLLPFIGLYVLAQIILIIVSAIMFGIGAGIVAFGLASKNVAILGVGLVVFLVLSILWFLFVMPWYAQIIYLAVLDKSERGTSSGVFTQAWHNAPSFFLTILISGILVYGNFTFLMIPGIILSFLILMWPFVFLIENKKGIVALGRSKELVRAGGAMRVFLYLTLFGFIAGALIFVPFIIVSITSTVKNTAVNVVGELIYTVSILVLTLFQMSFLYEMYLDLKSILPDSKGKLGIWTILGIIGFVLAVGFIAFIIFAGTVKG